MASIAKRSDGRWRARYRDAAEVEHSRHFTRKVEAQHWLDTVTTAVTSGTYTDPRRSRITVSDWSARWLATKVDLKATTRRGYDGMLRVHILTRWGAVKLADITHEQIAGWIAELRCSGLSASTVRQIHRVFSLVLALAVRDGRLARNPADGVRSRVPREGSRCSSRTISSMHWPMRRGASGS
jgi:hypothetical protein